MPRVYNKYKNPPADAIYIGRPSKFGNIFTLNAFGRADAIKRYEQWVYTQPDLIRAIKEELRGKDLICFCAPEGGLGVDDPLQCHGQIHLRIANE